MKVSLLPASVPVKTCSEKIKKAAAITLFVCSILASIAVYAKNPRLSEVIAVAGSSFSMALFFS